MRATEDKETTSRAVFDAVERLEELHGPAAVIEVEVLEIFGLEADLSGPELVELAETLEFRGHTLRGDRPEAPRRVVSGAGAMHRRAPRRVLDHATVLALIGEVANGARAIRALEHANPADRAILEAVVDRARNATNRLIEHNLGLVRAVASSLRGRGLDEDDLFQEGIVGLHRAIQKFDPDRGTHLSTYATWWIRQASHRAIADKARVVRLPVHVVETLAALRRARLRVDRRTGLPATTAELAVELGVDVATIERRLALEDRTTLPLDGSVDLVALETTDAAVCQQAVGRDLDVALAQLSEREAEVVRRRFGIGTDREETLERIGADLGVSRERVRQIEVRALERLRVAAASNGLHDHLVAA